MLCRQTRSQGETEAQRDRDTCPGDGHAPMLRPTPRPQGVSHTQHDATRSPESQEQTLYLTCERNQESPRRRIKITRERKKEGNRENQPLAKSECHVAEASTWRGSGGHSEKGQRPGVWAGAGRRGPALSAGCLALVPQLERSGLGEGLGLPHSYLCSCDVESARASMAPAFSQSIKDKTKSTCGVLWSSQGVSWEGPLLTAAHAHAQDALTRLQPCLHRPAL